MNNQGHVNEIHRINYLTTEMEAMYHQASLKMGITDSVSIVLYSVYDAENECLLSDIYKNSGISKQTINSAIRSLEADGILYLEQYSERKKKGCLDGAGKGVCAENGCQTLPSRMNTFDLWTKEEIETYIRLMAKYADCFRKQIDQL